MSKTSRTQMPTRLNNVSNNSTKNIEEKLRQAVSDVFCDDILNNIAKKTDFVQRSSSRISGSEFVQAMIAASIDPKSTPLSGINDNLRTINAKAQMTISALRQRINSPAAQAYMVEVFGFAMESKFKPLAEELNMLRDERSGALESFSNVYIHDSTRCALAESLDSHFKGCGGAASRSEVKLDVIYELKANHLTEVLITDVKEPDQALSKKILKHIEKDCLVIQDLGYFDLKTYAGIADRGGYFLTRLLGCVKVYLNQSDPEPVALGKHLQGLLMKGQPLDIVVYVSESRMKTRLVGYPVPDEVFAKRVREHRKTNKKGTASAEYIARQRFTILLTNVPVEVWSYPIAGTVYKIRWQIELLFKCWKSQLSLHYLKGTSPERIMCLIYARLITATLILSFYSGLAAIVQPLGLELSLTKFINWLKRNGRFSTIVIKGFTHELWSLLIRCLDLIEKDIQRKRKTTLQCILEQIPFIETFAKCA